MDPRGFEGCTRRSLLRRRHRCDIGDSDVTSVTPVALFRTTPEALDRTTRAARCAPRLTRFARSAPVLASRCFVLRPRPSSPPGLHRPHASPADSFTRAAGPRSVVHRQSSALTSLRSQCSRRPRTAFAVGARRCSHRPLPRADRTVDRGDADSAESTLAHHASSRVSSISSTDGSNPSGPLSSVASS